MHKSDGFSQRVQTLLNENQQLQVDLIKTQQALSVARNNEEESKIIAQNYATELEIKATELEEHKEDIQGALFISHCKGRF